ncbi:MAG: alpha-L-fucosidase-domain-containing protein [Benjaminiella poitrasii]|nr:MAG: alpha-L-fucosidase-domain-containing protein [Benjaminiella poitrasii]
MQRLIHIFYLFLFLYNDTLLLEASPLSSQKSSVVSKRQTNIKYVPISLDAWLNNKAFGLNANFDSLGNGFKDNTFEHPSLLIDYGSHSSNNRIPYDNVKITSNNSDSQVMIRLDSSNMSLSALYMLLSASHGPLRVNVKVSYSDGTHDRTDLSLPDWQDVHVNQMDRYQAIQYPLRDQPSTTLGALFSVPIYVNPFKMPKSLELIPQTTDKPETAVHLFSMIAYPTQRDEVTVMSVQRSWESTHTDESIVLVTVHNLGTTWIRHITARLIGHQESFRTSKHGPMVEAIAPGHVRALQVPVKQLSSSDDDYGSLDVHLTYATDESPTGDSLTVITTLPNDTVSLLLSDLTSQKEYKSTLGSVQGHQPPTWLKRSNFGLFIHWGLYAVPSWAPVGKSYAEWYWWNMNHKDDPAYEHHRSVYGEGFEYDHFLTEWKPTQFNPHYWLELIDQSKARYFVFTTKHHDGIAMFNTAVTNRSTMHLLEPPRDFVRELFQVAETKYPHLKRGLYFSLPEWYHPKYKDDSIGWQGPPVNPYSGQQTSYTGSKPIDDFVNELQVPQFQELVHNYKPDILWCDIGGIHNSAVWQADYFNQARKEGHQVAVNDRCGDGSASDFTTIEYQAVMTTPTRFWESTRGMDPYSFGFNRETKPDEYTRSSELVRNLVDVVSQGGNFLLNVGPDASGSVPVPMVERLRAIGEWLDNVGESIFGSIPYWISHERRDLRFTINEKGNIIYVFAFLEVASHQQSSSITVDVPLPITHQNDTGDFKVSLMNHRQTRVDWYIDNQLILNFDLPPKNPLTDTWALVFEIVFN